MTRMRSVSFALVILVLSGCATATVPSPPADSAVRGGPLADVRRLAIVPSGESQFTTAGATANTFDVGHVLREVARWYPKADFFAPLTPVIQAGVDWFLEQGRPSRPTPQVRDVSPGFVVAEAFARTLMAIGRFDGVQTLQREPVGEDRRQTEALLRLTVPTWGLVRVREGKPDLMATYVDVHAQVVLPATGVIVWEHEEDVTHADRVPLPTLTSDGALARQELLDVLERAGQRLANEFLYAQGVRP